MKLLTKLSMIYHKMFLKHVVSCRLKSYKLLAKRSLLLTPSIKNEVKRKHLMMYFTSLLPAIGLLKAFKTAWLSRHFTDDNIAKFLSKLPGRTHWQLSLPDD